MADDVVLGAEVEVDVAALNDPELDPEVSVALAVAVELDEVALGLDEVAQVVGGTLELDAGVLVGPVGGVGDCVGEGAGGLGFGGRLDSGGRTLVTSLTTGRGLFGVITP